MDIMERLTEDMKNAMRAKEQLRLSVIRMLKSSLKNAEIEKKDHKLEEADILSVLQREAKRRKEASEEFKKGNREELSQKELEELKIIEEYLPKQLSKEEIEAEAKKILDELPEAEKANFGMAMKSVMAQFKGKADGKLVSEVIKTILG
ncbi:MAG: GatB/YqeY domain-containing protein [Armatimonadota bacterium]